MTRLLNYFLRGLVVTAPLAVTVYICWRVFTTIDSWLGFRVPGVGFLITIVLITLVGVLASNLITRGVLGAFEGLLERVPLVRLLYGSTKDLLNAFVGEKRRFSRPVLVSLTPGGAPKMFGFLTQDSLEALGLADHVTVYLPQAYGFAGQLLVFPAAQVRPLQGESAELLAFIISGGVTQLPVRTIEAPE